MTFTRNNVCIIFYALNQIKYGILKVSMESQAKTNQQSNTSNAVAIQMTDL